MFKVLSIKFSGWGHQGKKNKKAVFSCKLSSVFPFLVLQFSVMMSLIRIIGKSEKSGIIRWT